MDNLTFSEALSSTGAVGGATACADCLTTWGADPMIAGPLAVIAGVLVRLAIDWAQRRLAARRAVAEAAPQPSPPPRSSP